MKRGDAWYKRYPDDYLKGTRTLSLEARGAYSDIIDLLYVNDGEMADDDKELAAALRISRRKWSQVKKELLAKGKLELQNGMIFNSRARVELEKRRSQALANREIAISRELQKREKLENSSKYRADGARTVQRSVSRTVARNEHHVCGRERAIESETDTDSSLTPFGPPSENRPTTHPPSAGAGAKQKRGSRLSADWALPDEWRAWTRINFAHASDPVVLAEADRFADYWRAKAGNSAVKLDWQATWRNWCRTAFGAKPSPQPLNFGRMAHDESRARKPTAREIIDQKIAEGRAKEAAAL